MSHFVKIAATGELIAIGDVKSILPLFDFTADNSINIESAETGTSANVVVTPSFGIKLVLRRYSNEEEVCIYQHTTTSKDILQIPLLQSKAFLSLPVSGSTDKKRILTQEQFREALHKYSKTVEELDMCRAANIPLANPSQVTVAGEAEQTPAPEPEVMVMERRPTELEVKLDKRLDILLSKMTKALNRDVTVTGKKFEAVDRGPVFTNLPLPDAIKFVKSTIGDLGDPEGVYTALLMGSEAAYQIV